MLHRQFIICFLTILFLYPTINLSSIERDYKYEGIKLFPEQPNRWNKIYEYQSDEVCKNCFLAAYGNPPQGLNNDQLDLIPTLSLNCFGKKCFVCGKEPFYVGYIHFTYRNDYPFLIRQLSFMQKHPNIDVFWPEYSNDALEISDLATSLFSYLIEKTSLNKSFEYTMGRKEFVLHSPYLKKYDIEIFKKSFASSCFWFSDYYQVIDDLKNFKRNKTYEQDKNLNIKLDFILSNLEERFVELYLGVQAVNPTAEIAQELQFIQYLNGSWNLEGNECDFLTTEEPATDQPSWFLAHYHFAKGLEYNHALLFESAIPELTKSIEFNSENFEAYIERAYAYFELQRFDLAIEDYKKAKKINFNNGVFLKNPMQSICDNHFEWGNQGGYVVINYSILAKEFAFGVTEGACVSAGDFIPNALGALSGIGHGLWAFVCSPSDVSRNFLEGMYNLISFIKENSTQEILEEMIPELRELIENWEALPEAERFNKIGFIIGKYGFDIFAPGVGMKGVKYYQELRRANSMMTLECCLTNEKRIKILEEVAKRDVWRSRLIEDGKIKIHWDMQTKHVPGYHNFDPTRGRVLISNERLEQILFQNAGEGQKIKNITPYSPGYRERVDFGEIIGEYVLLNANGEVILTAPTTKGIIHYSNKGIHVVPSDPHARMN